MKNVPEFEGLRGFLSTVVVLAHLYPPLTTWVWGSMDIFFCMSGFLIGQVIFKEHDKPGFLKHYAWRRITRIWPAYYVIFLGCLLFAFAVTRLSQISLPWPPGIGNALSFVFLQNTELLLHPGFVDGGLLPDYLPFMGHTWSVALEEQFYLVAPIVCIVLVALRRPMLWATIFASGCCIFGSVMRSEGFLWKILPARLDGFAVGILAAVVVHQGRISGRTPNATILFAWMLFGFGGSAIVLLYTLVPLPKFDLGAAALASPIVIYGVAAVAIFSGGLVLLLNTYTGQAELVVLRWPLLLRLGRMSYSTYLVHIPVIWYSTYILNHWMPLPEWERFFIQLSLCFGGAYVLYMLVERPVMQRRGSA